MSTHYVRFKASGVVEVEAGDWETAVEIADERLSNWLTGVDLDDDVELFDGGDAP